MPYIKRMDRARYFVGLDELAGMMVNSCNPGDLNYIISMVCAHYMSIKGQSYTHFNDVIGVLESAKLEFYRRKVAPYEDEKIKENGDV